MFKEIDQKRYDEILAMIPPSFWLGYGFLFGEAASQRACTVTGKVEPTYEAFVYAFGRFYEGDPMTIGEFRNLDLNALPLPK